MKKRMYIVDDDPDSADLIADFGAILGFDTHPFYTTTSFRRAVEQTMPEIIVIDLTIPEMDGIEIINWLGRLECKAGIVIISGFDDTLLLMASKIAELKHLNLYGALTKPLSLNAFREKLGADMWPAKSGIESDEPDESENAGDTGQSGETGQVKLARQGSH